MPKKSPSVGETVQREIPKPNASERGSIHENKLLAEGGGVAENREEGGVELEWIKQQLGLSSAPLSETAAALLSAFGDKLKKLLPQSEPVSGPHSSRKRLVQVFAFAGMQVITTDAAAQYRHSHHGRQEERHHGHSHRRAERSTRHVAHETQEQAPLHVHGFERIGISSADVARLFAESWPVFVETHGRIVEIEYIDRAGPRIDQRYYNLRQNPEVANLVEDAHYEYYRSGGRIRVFNRSFHEVDPVTHIQGEINFKEALLVLIHEMCHSFTFRMSQEDVRYFVEQMKGPHIALPYPDRFLLAAKEHRRVDYRAMAMEFVPELLAKIFELAPEGNIPLREHVITQLALRNPNLDRVYIEGVIDRLFAMAPGFDWEAAIGRFRKGSLEIARQFSVHQIQQQLNQLPPELQEILPGLDLPREPQGMGQRFQTETRLQQNIPLYRQYTNYRTIRLDEVDTSATRLQMRVPVVHALKEAWEGALSQLNRFYAQDYKNRVNTAEMAPAWLAGNGITDLDRHGELHGMLQGFNVARIRELWAQVPEAERANVQEVLRQDAVLRTHREPVPAAIVAEAERVLAASPLRPL